MIPTAAPARPPRPTSVTTASWLQIAAVVVLLALAGVLVWQAVDWDGQIDRAARLVPDADPEEVRSERFGNVFMTCLLGVPTLLFAGWLGATAVGVRRGSNTARILVFVAGGCQLLLTCGQGCSGALAIPLMFGVADADAEEWDTAVEGVLGEQSRFLDTLYPPDASFSLRDDILFGTATGGTVLVFLLTLAAVVLLALPVAQRWFVPPARHAVRPPAPVTFMLPPGYMVCPDPRAHGVPPQVPPAATPPPGTATSDPHAPAGPVAH
ncbi:hypothetical protein E1166_24430 [Micromonospora sp. KC213]|nr:hypothetical protein E1166_24430 [Micromonospora sp. KC213]